MTTNCSQTKITEFHHYCRFTEVELQVTHALHRGSPKQPGLLHLDCPAFQSINTVTKEYLK